MLTLAKIPVVSAKPRTTVSYASSAGRLAVGQMADYGEEFRLNIITIEPLRN
jgi:hypothetical protein